MHKKTTNINRGTTLMLLATAIVALIGAAALAIDIGKMYLASQRAQDVCDSAALAGAAYLTGLGTCTVVDDSSGVSTSGDGESARAAKDTAQANNSGRTFPALHPTTGAAGIKVSFPSGTITRDDGRQIQAKLGEAIQTNCKVRVEFGFARIFGLGGMYVHGEAIALLQQSESISSDRFSPWVVGDTTIWNVNNNPPTPIVPLGTRINMVVSDWPSGILGPGNYGAIAYAGDQGGAAYRDRIAGVAPPVKVTLSGEPGGSNRMVRARRKDRRIQKRSTGSSR